MDSALLQSWAAELQSLTLDGSSCDLPGMVGFAEAAVNVMELDLYLSDRRAAAAATYLLPSFPNAWNIKVYGVAPSAYPRCMESLEVDFDDKSTCLAEPDLLLYAIARHRHLKRLVLVCDSPGTNVQLTCPVDLNPQLEVTVVFRIDADAVVDLSWLQHQPYSMLSFSIMSYTNIQAQHEEVISQLLQLRVDEVDTVFNCLVPPHLRRLWQQVENVSFFWSPGESESSYKLTAFAPPVQDLA